MSPATLVGILLILILIVSVSLLASRRVADADDFATASGRGSTSVVVGIIMTSLVGGQSTLGTAQLAFAYGTSAWWFTIGAALGCLLLALGYGQALRRSSCSTLLQAIDNAYGPHAETWGSLLCCIGIFISIVAQVVASTAILTGLLHLAPLPAALISVALMIIMVFLGGVWGAGYSGMLKTTLLCLTALVAGSWVLLRTGGYRPLQQDIANQTLYPPLSDYLQLHNAEEVHRRYNHLLARGPLKDIGGAFSLMLGVVSTQSYAQAIWAARDLRTARRGSLICAIITPLIGAGCILVGLYMRAHYITAEEQAALLASGAALPPHTGVLRHSAEVFPVFLLQHLPPLLAGIMLGTLLLTIIGGGSGLSLGAATILVRDLFGHRPHPRENTTTDLLRLRLTIVALLAVATLCSFIGNRAFINDLGFLSLGLRATAVLVPLTAALYRPRLLTPKAAVLSMTAGSLMLIVANALSLPGAPIFWGLLAALLPCTLAPLRSHHP